MLGFRVWGLGFRVWVQSGFEFSAVGLGFGLSKTLTTNLLAALVIRCVDMLHRRRLAGSGILSFLNVAALVGSRHSLVNADGRLAVI